MGKDSQRQYAEYGLGVCRAGFLTIMASEFVFRTICLAS
jgi:hypothetical protein